MRSLTVPAPVLLGGLGIGAVIGFGIGMLVLNVDGHTVSVTASGETEWMYQDSHSAMNPLDPERFGTPQNPKGIEILPLINRAISRSGTSYTGLNDGQVFSLDRTMVHGSVRFTGTDLTPLDSYGSLDSAEAEATFTSPDGAEYRVVLTKLAPPTSGLQTFGGVAINQIVHYTTGFGTDKLYPEYAYLVVQGLGDVYRNGELIATDIYTYFAASRRAQFVTNEDKRQGLYNPEKPLAAMIVHVVLLPHRYMPDGSYVRHPIPTGFIGPDGKEQEFFHINYRDNLAIEGSRFFDREPKATTSASHAH